MKRLTAFLLACIIVLLTAGCEMRGDTLELDVYSAKRLTHTLEAIQSGDLKIVYPDTETLPKMQAQILNHPGKLARIINIYIYNESTYDANFHGYFWLVSGSETCKGIYYNSEKKVSNSTYRIRLDTGSNAYFLYELLVNEPITLDEELAAFVFFKYEDTEYIMYVGGDDTVVCWPKEQTLNA